MRVVDTLYVKLKLQQKTQEFQNFLFICGISVIYRFPGYHRLLVFGRFKPQINTGKRVLFSAQCHSGNFMIIVCCFRADQQARAADIRIRKYEIPIIT